MVAGPARPPSGLPLEDLLRGDTPKELKDVNFKWKHVDATGATVEEDLVVRFKSGRIEFRSQTNAREKFKPASPELEKAVKEAFLDTSIANQRSAIGSLVRLATVDTKIDYAASADTQVQSLSDTEKRALTAAKVPISNYLEYKKTEPSLPIADLIRLHEDKIEPKDFAEKVRLKNKGIILDNGEFLKWMAYDSAKKAKAEAFCTASLKFPETDELLGSLPGFDIKDLEVYLKAFTLSPKLAQADGSGKKLTRAQAILFWEKQSGVKRDFLLSFAEIEGSAATANSKTLIAFHSKLHGDSKELKRYGDLKKRFTTLTTVNFLTLVPGLTDTVAEVYQKASPPSLTWSDLNRLVKCLGTSIDEYQKYKSAHTSINVADIETLKGAGIGGQSYLDFKNANPGISHADVMNAVRSGKKLADLKAEQGLLKAEEDEKKKLDAVGIAKKEQEPFLKIAAELGEASLVDQVDLVKELYKAGFKTAPEVRALWDQNRRWMKADLLHLGQHGLRDKAAVEDYLTAKGEIPSAQEMVRMSDQGLRGDAFKKYRNADEELKVEDVLRAYRQKLPDAVLATRKAIATELPSIDADGQRELARNGIDAAELALYLSWLPKQGVLDYCELKKQGVTGQDVEAFHTQDSTLIGDLATFKDLAVTHKMKANTSPDSFKDYLAVVGEPLKGKTILPAAAARLPASRLNEYRNKNSSLAVTDAVRLHKATLSPDEYKGFLDAGLTEVVVMLEAKGKVTAAEAKDFWPLFERVEPRISAEKDRIDCIGIWKGYPFTASDLGTLLKDFPGKAPRADLDELGRAKISLADVTSYYTTKGKGKPLDLTEVRTLRLATPALDSSVFWSYRDKEARLTVDDIINLRDGGVVPNDYEEYVKLGVATVTEMMSKFKAGETPAILKAHQALKTASTAPHSAADIAKLHAAGVTDTELIEYENHPAAKLTVDQILELKKRGVSGAVCGDFFRDFSTATFTDIDAFKKADLLILYGILGGTMHVKYKYYMAAPLGFKTLGEILDAHQRFDSAVSGKRGFELLEEYRVANGSLTLSDMKTLLTEKLFPADYDAYFKAGLDSVLAIIEAKKEGVTVADWAAFAAVLGRVQFSGSGDVVKLKAIARWKRFSYTPTDLNALVTARTTSGLTEANVDTLGASSIALADVLPFYAPPGGGLGRLPSLDEVILMRTCSSPIDATLFFAYRGLSTLLTVQQIIDLHVEGVDTTRYSDFVAAGQTNVTEMIRLTQNGTAPATLSRNADYKRVDGNVSNDDIEALLAETVVATAFQEYRRTGRKNFPSVDEIISLARLGITGPECGQFFRDFPGPITTVDDLMNFGAYGLLMASAGGPRYQLYRRVPGRLTLPQDILALHQKFDGVSITGTTGPGMLGEAVVTGYRTYRSNVTPDEMMRLYDAGIMPTAGDFGACIAAHPNNTPIAEIITERVARGRTPINSANRNALRQVNGSLSDIQLDTLINAGVSVAAYQAYYAENNDLAVREICEMQRLGGTPTPFGPTNYQEFHRALASIPVASISYLWRAGVIPADLIAIQRVDASLMQDWASNGAELTRILVNERLRAGEITAYLGVDPTMKLARMRELNNAGINGAAFGRWFAMDPDISIDRIQALEASRTRAATRIAATPIAANDVSRNEFLEDMGLHTTALDWARAGRSMTEIQTLVDQMVAGTPAAGEAPNLRRLVVAQVLEGLRNEYQDQVIEAKRDGRNQREVLGMPFLRGLHDSIRRRLVLAIFNSDTRWNRARDWTGSKLMEAGAAIWEQVKNPSRLIAGQPGDLRRVANKFLYAGSASVLEGAWKVGTGTLEAAAKPIFSVLKIVPYGVASMARTTVTRMRQAASLAWFPPTIAWATTDANAKWYSKVSRRFKNTFTGAWYGLRYGVAAPLALAAGAVGAVEGLGEGVLRGVGGYEAPEFAPTPAAGAAANGAPVEAPTWGIRGIFSGIADGARRAWGITEVSPRGHAENFNTWAATVDAARDQEADETMAEFLDSPTEVLIQGMDRLQWRDLKLTGLYTQYSRLLAANQNLRNLSSDARQAYQDELFKFLGLEGNASLADAQYRANEALNQIDALPRTKATRANRIALRGIYRGLLDGVLLDDTSFEVPANTPPAPTPAAAAGGGTP